LGQIAKFELSEIDDTIENRKKTFESILDDSIKDTCLEYIQGLPQETLDAIKQEFSGKTFNVSQGMVWRNGSVSYSNQLVNFANLSKLVQSKLEQISQEQSSLAKATQAQNITPSQDNNELKSAILEIILDGLYYITPKIIDKKDAGYVAA
jgi:magnesium chelatase subunit I